METLRASTARGIKWTATSAGFIAVTAPLFQVVKARFLTPEEFAYLAVLFIFIGFARHLEGAGFTKGAIQKDHVDVEEASTLFMFNMAAAALMAVILFLAAGAVAIFFDLYRLDYYLRVLSLVILSHGPSRFFRTFLEKFFLFKEIALVEIIRQALLIAITIFLLVLGWGVLGFVYGQVAAALTSTFLFVFLGVKHKVAGLRWYFSFDKLRFFIRFGAFVSGRGVLNYATKHIDEVAIGYFLDPEVLGTYYFGKNILNRLRMLLNRSYSKVLFPLFSSLKNEQQRLSDVYYKLTRYVAMAALPLFMGISLTAHLFVPVIFGRQWAGSIIVIEVFSAVFVLKMLTDGLATNVLYAVNRPDTAFYLDVVTDGLYFLALVFFASRGMHAILIMYASYTAIRALAMQYAAHRHLSGSMLHYFYLLRGVAVLSLAMIAAVVGFQRVFSAEVGEAVLLAGSIAVGVLVYSLMTLHFDKKGVKELRRLMQGEAKRA